MRVAYFINQYPKVSHSFIRREILALEAQGVTVQRLALRGWDAEIVDSEDAREREKTRYVLRQGVKGLLSSTLSSLLRHPVRFLAALRLAVSMASGSDRALPYHVIYLLEACQLVRWMQDFGAAHVHAHFGTNPAEVVMLARALGGPVYSFTVHGPEEFDKPQALGLAEKIRRAGFVVAISSYGRSQLYRWVEHAQWPKIRVVHCGLEAAFYDVVPLAISKVPRLVCVGRLCEQKGQLLLLEAARKLSMQGVPFELVLAGDGEMRVDIERLIQAYGLVDRVSITGWVSSERVREEILAARALVLPSFAEGLPVVIMEAMALRRPVISTFVAGIPELVVAGKNGWLVPAGAVDELVAAMQEALTLPDSQMAVMGEAAYVRVTQRHAIAREAAKLLALFQEYQE